MHLFLVVLRGSDRPGPPGPGGPARSRLPRIF